MDSLVSSRPLLTGRLRRRLTRHHLPLIVLTAIAVTVLVFAAPNRGELRSEDRPSVGSSQVGSMSHGPGRPGSDPAPVDPAAASAAHQPGQRFDHGSGMGGMPSPVGSLTRPLTTATGYIGLVMLAVTLLIGPAQRLMRRATPLSLDLRRDIGVWTAMVSLVHVVLGFQIHEGGRILSYFLNAETLAPHLNAFSLANYTGLAATGILLILVAISNDAALRRLKARSWKRVQRLSFAAFALVVVHSILYGALGSRATLYSVLLVVSVAVVVLFRIGSTWAARSALAQSPAQ